MSAPDSMVFLAGRLLVAALYIPGILLAITRRRGQENVSGLVGLYGLAGLSLDLVEALGQSGVDPQTFRNIEVDAALALAFLTVLILRLFMRRSIPGWIGLGLGFGAGLYYFSRLGVQNPGILLTYGQWTLTNVSVGLAWAVLGWLVFMIGAAGMVLQAYRRTGQPLMRNRLIYWVPVLFLISINDGLIVAGHDFSGHPLRWLAFSLMAYVALTHNLPYLRRILQRGLLYLLTLLLVLVFYLIGVTLAPLLHRAFPGLVLSWAGLVIAAALALFFIPSLTLMRRSLERRLDLDSNNAGRILQAYSESISNILNVERLAAVAVSAITDSMQVRHGKLILVDSPPDEPHPQVYKLHPIRQAGQPALPDITLSEDSPIAASFAREDRPLLQYDLDLLPSLQSLSAAERVWFKTLEAEVYLPIASKTQWIGLLAFGSKRNGNRFSEEDLLTLSALANQTAVALENARLVDHLVQLNADLTQARLELENNNRLLERLDRTKSEFISIASHELRTPLTVIKGYSEMLMEKPGLDGSLRKAIRGIHDGALRLHEIMDSMFDIARIDARVLQLQLQPVDLGTLLQEVCSSFSQTARGRSISLSLDLPGLPRVLADPDSLRKVFQHLVNNAIKFTPDGGKVALTGQIAAENPAEGQVQRVELIVSDTGVGVDPDLREIIFTKFYQPGDPAKHSTSKSRFKGSGAGLGLALAKGIVEAHGGQIWVESPGYDEQHLPGSRFHVVIPCTNAARDVPLQNCPPIQLSF